MKHLILVPILLFAGPAVGGTQDGPQKPELYLYHQINLLVDKNIEVAEQLWTRAAKAGYTKVFVADSKLAKLGDMKSRGPSLDEVFHQLTGAAAK